MRLRPAPGSQEMQDALRHPLVRKIVTILLEVIDEKFFKYAALFLRAYNQRIQPRFVEDLKALHTYAKKLPNEEGLFVYPTYVNELISALEALYQQPDRIVGYQRGAIVELLATELVCSRYKNGECFDNQSFHDEQSSYRSSQVDVAVLSHNQQQIEAYTCKIKADKIESVDCTNLTALANIAEMRGYYVRIGAISFDNSGVISRKIEGIPLTRHIDAYGVDNFSKLRERPD